MLSFDPDRYVRLLLNKRLHLTIVIQLVGTHVFHIILDGILVRNTPVEERSPISRVEHMETRAEGCHLLNALQRVIIHVHWHVIIARFGDLIGAFGAQLCRFRRDKFICGRIHNHVQLEAVR